MVQRTRSVRVLDGNLPREKFSSTSRMYNLRAMSVASYDRPSIQSTTTASLGMELLTSSLVVIVTGDLCMVCSFATIHLQLVFKSRKQALTAMLTQSCWKVKLGAFHGRDSNIIRPWNTTLIYCSVYLGSLTRHIVTALFDCHGQRDILEVGETPLPYLAAVSLSSSHSLNV